MERITLSSSTWCIHFAGGTEDVTLRGSGVFVPMGTTVMAFHQAAQTHPGYWPDPQMFHPSLWMPTEKCPDGFRRRAGTHEPFILGPANCAGNFLADYKGTVILAELYR